MKKKGYTNIVKQIAGSVVLLGIMTSGNAVADVMVVKKSSSSKHKPNLATGSVVGKNSPITNKVNGRNPKEFALSNKIRLTSTGGLLYGDPDKDVCWFHLSGAVRMDESVFSGNYRDTGFGVTNPEDSLPSGANIRAAQLYLDGGFAPCWEFTLGLDFAGSVNNLYNNVVNTSPRGSVSAVKFVDSWVAYSGFAENNEVFVGRVSGSWFGLENANSTTWMPFMERSLQNVAFYPGDGLGVMTDWWWCDGALTLVAHQPDAYQRDLDNHVRDRWVITSRVTYAPVHTEGDVWHFGVSGSWKEANSSNVDNRLNRLAFGSHPGIRARRTPFLVATGDIILANRASLYNVEFARQYGPVLLEAEYTGVSVHRAPGAGNAPQNPGVYGGLKFHGYNIQGRYMLTGESHAYDVRDGAFGSVKPRSCFGAREIAVRYDFLNLNDKDIFGGAQHNVSLALNWFINEHVRLSTNYIRANIHPKHRDIKRNVDMIGFRAQFRFK